MSIKNSSDTIGNRTRDIPAYSAVPQSTALPRAPEKRTTEIGELSHHNVNNAYFMYGENVTQSFM